MQIYLFLLVGLVGLEPTREYSRQILSLLRIPIPPQAQCLLLVGIPRVELGWRLPRQILSLMRLPIPPYAQLFFMNIFISFILNNVNNYFLLFANLFKNFINCFLSQSNKSSIFL